MSRLGCSVALVHHVVNFFNFAKTRAKSILSNSFDKFKLTTMGIKGLYGYCLREVKESYQTVSILEEIAKYQR